MNVPTANNRPDDIGARLGASATSNVVVLEERPAAPSGAPACSAQLPRDLLVRLAALSRQVGDIRQEHAAHLELSLRLDDVEADLGGLIQGIYDETVRHLVGQRG